MNINNKCKYHCSFQENITKLSSSLVYSMSLSEEEAESKSEAFKESATQDDAGVKSYNVKFKKFIYWCNSANNMLDSFNRMWKKYLNYR